MFSFLQTLDRISRLWTPSAALHNISSPHTSSLIQEQQSITIVVQAEQQISGEQCVPNNFWSISEAKKGFVSMLHWSHWPIHSASFPIVVIDNLQHKTQIKVISGSPFLPWKKSWIFYGIFIVSGHTSCFSVNIITNNKKTAVILEYRNHLMNKMITENTLPDSLISIFPAWAYCQLWLSNTAIVGQSRPLLNHTQVSKTHQAI